MLNVGPGGAEEFFFTHGCTVTGDADGVRTVTAERRVLTYNTRYGAAGADERRGDL